MNSVNTDLPRSLRASFQIDSFLERKEQTILTQRHCVCACPKTPLSSVQIARPPAHACLSENICGADRKRLILGCCPICSWRGSEGRCNDKVLPGRSVLRCSSLPFIKLLPRGKVRGPTLLKLNLPAILKCNTIASLPLPAQGQNTVS